MRIRLLKLLLIGSIVSLVTIGSCKKDDPEPPTPTPTTDTGVFTDNRDGKEYKWVKIGQLTWMAENLAYKPTNPGGFIAYDNDENNVSIYGYLYNQETAKVNAPDGWRLPTKEEFNTLVKELGGDVPAYNKLLESGTEHWESPSNGTNESGFTAIPGGHYYSSNNKFWGKGELAVFISSSIHSNGTSVIALNLNRNFLDASVEGNNSEAYYSVRCVKD